jgi:hypothetical protein
VLKGDRIGFFFDEAGPMVFLKIVKAKTYTHVGSKIGFVTPVRSQGCGPGKKKQVKCASFARFQFLNPFVYITTISFLKTFFVESSFRFC